MSEYNIRYTETGRMVHLVESLNNGGHLVQPIIEDQETGELYTEGKDKIVYQLFTQPPLEKYAAEIEQQMQRLDDLRAQESELRKSVYEAQREQRENLQRIEDATAIRNIDRVLRNEFEYIVIEEYSFPRIVKADEAVYQETGYSNQNGKLRALMLCFQRETRERHRPRLYWWISRYSDGSGDAEPCTIHPNYESARARAQEMLDDKFKRNPNESVGDYLLDYAAKHNLSLPVDRVNKHAAFKLAQAQKTIADRRADLAKAEAELAALTPQEEPPC